MENKINSHIELSGFKVPVKRSKEDAWLLLNQKIEQQAAAVPSRKVFHLNWIVGSAAAVAVFLLIMYMGMFNTGKYSPDFVSSLAKTDSVFLPDGSLVALNSNSKCKYHFNKFTGERNVVLNGEAYFNVKKGRKFLVEFEGGKVEVHGTSFNVVAYNDKYLQVDCTSGSVSFVAFEQTVSLKKGQGAKVFHNKVVGPYTIDTNKIMRRLDGIYYWDKISIEELVHLIGYRFGYEVDVAESVANKNFSGEIDLANLRNCLTIVAYAMDIRYSINENTQTIKVNAK